MVACLDSPYTLKNIIYGEQQYKKVEESSCLGRNWEMY